MENLIFRGALLKFKFTFDKPKEEVYMLAQYLEGNNIFQLICVSGYKSGSIGGLIRKDSDVIEAVAVTVGHLKIELKRNFLNFEPDSLVFFETVGCR